MKHAILIIVSLVLASCSWRPDPWRREDTYRHIALTGLMVIDWQQAKEIANKPKEYEEINPFIGEHPDLSTINLYTGVSYITKTGIAYVLPEEWREKWQWLNIGISIGCVAHNYSIGLKGEW